MTRGLACLEAAKRAGVLETAYDDDDGDGLTPLEQVEALIEWLDRIIEAEDAEGFAAPVDLEELAKSLERVDPYWLREFADLRAEELRRDAELRVSRAMDLLEGALA